MNKRFAALVVTGLLGFGLVLPASASAHEGYRDHGRHHDRYEPRHKPHPKRDERGHNHHHHHYYYEPYAYRWEPPRYPRHSHHYERPYRHPRHLVGDLELRFIFD